MNELCKSQINDALLTLPDHTLAILELASPGTVVTHYPRSEHIKAIVCAMQMTGSIKNETHLSHPDALTFLGNHKQIEYSPYRNNWVLWDDQQSKGAIIGVDADLIRNVCIKEGC